jgi:26S proteasome regulatory subunit T5
MDVEREIFGDAAAAEEPLPPEFSTYSAEAISQRSRLLENEIRVLKDESTRLSLEQNALKEKIKENKEKIKLNNQLPCAGEGWHAQNGASALACGTSQLLEEM